MKKIRIIILLLFYNSIAFSQTISAPINYENINEGNFQLEYEFGLPYNPKLPTLIVVSDAQQFYVRAGRINKIQNELFGKNFNVLGLIPRSNNQDLIAKVKLVNNGTTDWGLAYSVFKSYQFVNDLNLVIKEVLNKEENIYLYGQSGGAFLITEYLSEFPNSRVKKIFLGASVNPVIENKLGIIHDNFNRDFLSKNKLEQEKLEAVLSERFFDKIIVANLFQRQNFFVELKELHKKRSELINRLYVKDTAFVNHIKKEYQIDAINNLFESSRGISIRVRLTEFINPLLEDWEKDGNIFYPDLENSYNVAQPLLKLENNEFNFSFSKGFNEKRFRKYRGKVFILSGRHDHVADYRSSIYLNGLLENSYLFIADEDHTFKSLKSSDDYKNLIQDFFSNTDQEWVIKYNRYKWKEK